MQDSQDIRRLPNGSIDIDHYVRRGRALHGAAVRRAAAQLASVPARLLDRLASAVRELPRGATDQRGTVG